MRKVLAWGAGVVVVLILIGVAAGGEKEDTKPSARATTAASSKTAAERTSTDDRDRARARAVRRAYGADALDRWQIEKVTVDGADVVITTGLYPKPSNEPGFTGACSSIMDYFSWMKTISVKGNDGTTHATWTAGDTVCQTQGV